MELLCPICAAKLQLDTKSCRCDSGHCFDVARQGYIHLLPVQQKHSLFPGDTKEQVASRREFLSAGFYEPIANALCDTARSLGAQGPIVDVGCGEGYYSTRLAQTLGAALIGLDISKEAVRRAAGTYKNATWLCASAARLPLPDHSAGCVTSLFALTVAEEFRRVLRKDGLYFQILAAEDHLMALKSIIYPELFHKEKQTIPEIPGFTLVKTLPIRFSFTVEGRHIQNLLSMTPHVYRISKEGAQRLENTQILTDTASCVLNVYRPEP